MEVFRSRHWFWSTASSFAADSKVDLQIESSFFLPKASNSLPKLLDILSHHQSLSDFHISEKCGECPARFERSFRSLSPAGCNDDDDESQILHRPAQIGWMGQSRYGHMSVLNRVQHASE